METTLTRAQARRLIDCIPDEPEYEALMEALDTAQGEADEPGKNAELVIKITGADL